MYKFIFGSITVISLVLSSTAFAGEYVKFCAEKKLEALEGAMALAEKTVKSRGKGCVGPGKSGEAASQSYADENGEKCLGVFINHTDGACGKKKTLAELRKEYGI